ncbi:MAG: hypothetical protein P4L84_20380 [Isosphaeraceae bacterium]|nr:hypothetical protein [Isosphaeraceae bacterium]
MSLTTRPAPLPSVRDTQAVIELSVGVFRRDVLAFYPQSRFEAESRTPLPGSFAHGSAFRLVDVVGEDLDTIRFDLFGIRHRLTPRPGLSFTAYDRRMVHAIGSLLSLRFHHLFQTADASRLELFRGGSDDHYVAAFVDPSAYALTSQRPSRIASTIQTLRTTALSTYENRRVSTGALLLGPEDDLAHALTAAAPDALPYGVELTSLKSIHRLCDGKRTLFLVDREGKLADIIDVKRWAAALPDMVDDHLPCARAYTPHARATRTFGHICLVLSPNQEIKLFAGGVQAFAFAHGRWRILDPQSKFSVWEAAVGNPLLARKLFQAALDLAESREGGLFVVVSDPCEAIGRLIAPHDLLASEPPCGPPPELTPGDPLAKRALHYLARNRSVTELDPSVLESLAGLDGAIATDRAGRLLAFGAILRHDAASLPGLSAVEGARTTAALVASRFGPVLKVSEDGIVSCFLDGTRVWDL